MLPGRHINVLCTAWLCLTGIALAWHYWSDSPDLYHAASNQQSPICGHVAVVNVCRARGLAVSLADVIPLMPVSSRGSTLADVRNALAELGVEYSLTNPATSAALPDREPAICAMRVRGGYHAVVAFAAPGSVMVVDGRHVHRYSPADFDSCFAGVALIPAASAEEMASRGN